MNVLYHRAQQNARDGKSSLVNREASLHSLRTPASKTVQIANGFLDTLARKLKDLFMLHLKPTKLTKFREKTKTMPGIQSLRVSKYVKSHHSHEENCLHAARTVD